MSKIIQPEPDIFEDERPEFRNLSTISHLRTLTKLSLIIIGIGSSYLLVKLGTDNQLFYLFIAAFLVMTWTQHAIMEELHDGSHYRLASERKVNEYLAQLYGSLIGISLVNYRIRHKLHHRHFGTEQDPDLSQYKTCPVGLKEWGSYLFVNFTGYGALKSLVTLQSTLSAGKPSLQHPGFTIVVQLFLLIVGVVLNLPLFYFFFWFAPLLTLTYGISHFRTLLEHWNAETWLDPKTGEICYGAFYDFTRGVQSHLFGAPFGYNRHGTHHSVPSVPNYNLSKIEHEDYRVVPEHLIRSTTFFARLRAVLRLSY